MSGGAFAAFGDFVFAMHERGDAVNFNALSRSRNTRMSTHATISGVPIVEAIGLDAETVRLSGVLASGVTGDVDAALDRLRALQDGKPHPLTRGSRYYGLFVVRSFTYSEDQWSGDALAVATWTLELIATREGANG